MSRDDAAYASRAEARRAVQSAYPTVSPGLHDQLVEVAFDLGFSPRGAMRELARLGVDCQGLAPCSTAGCNLFPVAKGLCATCYQRARRGGGARPEAAPHRISVRLSHRTYVELSSSGPVRAAARRVLEEWATSRHRQ